MRVGCFRALGRQARELYIMQNAAEVGIQQNGKIENLRSEEGNC